MKQTLYALVWLAIFSGTLRAQASTYSQPVGADTFVSTGATNSNFGSLGAMQIAAPTAAQPRTLLTLLSFDTSGLRDSFDADFGANNWTVTSVTLTLGSTFATAGQQPNNSSYNRIAAGNFEFDLLGNNNWSEGGTTWNTLPGILPGSNNGNTLTSLGTFFWPATGQGSSTWNLNLNLNLAQKIISGDLITLLGQPTAGSTVGYLFNSRSVNPSLLNVTAAAVPEPSTVALLTSFLCLIGGSKIYRR